MLLPLLDWLMGVLSPAAPKVSKTITNNVVLTKCVNNKITFTKTIVQNIRFGA